MQKKPLLVEPVAKEFEYAVRLAVAIPLAWATILKTAGEHHYDWKCREMAERGVVNALYNIASFNEVPEHGVDGAAWPSTHPVAWNDCDGMLKILEQSAGVSDPVVVGEIRAWLCRTMERIFSRHSEIVSDPRVEVGSALPRLGSSEEVRVTSKVRRDRDSHDDSAEEFSA